SHRRGLRQRDARRGRGARGAAARHRSRLPAAATAPRRGIAAQRDRQAAAGGAAGAAALRRNLGPRAGRSAGRSRAAGPRCCSAGVDSAACCGAPAGYRRTVARSLCSPARAPLREVHPHHPHGRTSCHRAGRQQFRMSAPPLARRAATDIAVTMPLPALARTPNRSPTTYRETGMGIIIWLIVGGIVGWLASIIMKRDGQQGILLNIIVGIVGALIGGWLIGPLLGAGSINDGITV